MREKLELIPFLKIFTAIVIGAAISMIAPIGLSLAALLITPLPLFFIKKFPTLSSYTLLLLLGLSLPYLQNDETMPLNKNFDATIVLTDTTAKQEIYIGEILSEKKKAMIIFKTKENFALGDTIRATILPEDLHAAHYTLRKLTPKNETDLCAKIIGEYQRTPMVGVFEKRVAITQRINHWCSHRLKELNISTADIGIINGMLLGNREEIDREKQEQYTQTGISHLLSISGMHISVLFMILNILFIFRNHSFVGRVAGSVGIILLIWGYTLIVGAPISALRATIMFTILQISMMKIVSPMQIFNTLFATATLFILYNYKVILDVGFQLSFVSLLSIILFLPLFKGRNYFLQIICVTIAAQILTTPLVLHYFGYFSPISLIANIFGSVAITLIMFFSIGYIIIPNFIFEWIIKTIFSGLNYSLKFLTDIPFSYIDNLHFSVTDILIYYLLIFLAFSSIKKRV